MSAMKALVLLLLFCVCSMCVNVEARTAKNLFEQTKKKKEKYNSTFFCVFYLLEIYCYWLLLLLLLLSGEEEIKITKIYIISIEKSCIVCGADGGEWKT